LCGVPFACGKRKCAGSRRRHRRRSIPYGSHHSGRYHALENSLRADTFSSRRRLGGTDCRAPARNDRSGAEVCRTTKAGFWRCRD